MEKNNNHRKEQNSVTESSVILSTMNGNRDDGTIPMEQV